MYEHPFLSQLAVTKQYCKKLSEFYSQEAESMKKSGIINCEQYYLNRKRIVDNLEKSIENVQFNLGEHNHVR